MVQAILDLSLQAIGENLISYFLNKRAHRGITLLLLCILIWQITSIFWIFMPSRHTNVLPLHTHVSHAKPLADIAAWHLFGDYQPPASAIPASQSSLQLVGIMKAEPIEQSQVMIATNRGEKVYQLNDRLPNGAILKQILDDAVLIEQNGSLEKLVLPQLELEFKRLPAATMDDISS